MVIKYDKMILNIPEKLLQEFDHYCEINYFTRSEGIKQAMRDFIVSFRGEDYLPPDEQQQQLKVFFKSMMDAGLDLSKDPKYAGFINQNQIKESKALPSKSKTTKNS